MLVDPSSTDRSRRPPRTHRARSWGVPWAHVALLIGGALAGAASASPIVIDGTLEVATGYPQVHVQVYEGDRALTAEAARLSDLAGMPELAELDDLLGGGTESSFRAFLDTGASAHNFSQSTARRFGIAAVPGAVYHEIGLHGLTAVDVSRPFDLALADSTGTLEDAPRVFHGVQRGAVFQLSRAAAANPLVSLTLGEINVVGMPAIRHLIFEFDPAPVGGGSEQLKALGLDDVDLGGLEALLDMGQLGRGPAVRMIDRARLPATFDAVVDLQYVDFSRRRNPDDRPPLPDLAANPVVAGIEAAHDGKVSEGDWLLDTGAPASMISVAQAHALGLFDADGRPRVAPAFTLPMAGVGGQVREARGYRIDRLRVTARDGVVLEFRHVHVIVHDVSTTLDSGQRVTLDGIFGMNLLLPTVGGLQTGLPSRTAEAPFSRFWVDGPRGRLLLQRPRR